MKSVKKDALKILKLAIDKEVNADKELSSRCVSIFYQPKRNIGISKKNI